MDAAKSLSPGLIKKESEGFLFNFNPDFMKWLNPNLKYSSAFGWQLSNNQTTSPEDNAANVATNSILTSSISFSPTDLIEIYYQPEKKKKRNSRGRGRNNKEEENNNKEIDNPA